VVTARLHAYSCRSHRVTDTTMYAITEASKKSNVKLALGRQHIILPWKVCHSLCMINVKNLVSLQ
jgi:hypothetical protein